MSLTFTPSIFAIMPVRLWLAKLEARLLTWGLGKFTKPEFRAAYLDMLNAKIQALVCKVGFFWKDFYIPEAEWDQSLFLNCDDLETGMVNYFILIQEFLHYDRIRRTTQKQQSRLKKQLYRRMPTWVRWNDARVKRQEQLSKSIWKYNWMAAELSSERFEDQRMMENFNILIGMLATLAFLAFPVFYIVGGQEALLLWIANFLSLVSHQFNVSFQTVYAGFGYAVLVMITLTLSFAIGTRPRRHDLDEWFRALDANTQERLAEIAYHLPAREEAEDE